MNKIFVQSRGNTTIRINADYIILRKMDQYNYGIAYFSALDSNAVINKLSSDIIAKKNLTLEFNQHNFSTGSMERMSFDSPQTREMYTRVVKEQNKLHLINVDTSNCYFFYTKRNDFNKQLRDFFIEKHKLFFSDEDLEEVIKKHATPCISIGHANLDLHAYHIKIWDVKNVFLKKNPLFMSEFRNSIEFIKKHSDTFRQALKKNVKVLYDENKDYGLDKYGVKAIPGQEVAWGAGIEVLKKHDFLYLAAEMGLGKTISSLIINDRIQTEHRKKENYVTVIAAPTATMRGREGGWSKEIADIFRKEDGGLTPHEVIMITSENGFEAFKKTIDRINLKNPDKKYFIIISKEALKLSYSRIPQYQIKIKSIKEKRVSYTLHCPNCGSQIVDLQKGDSLSELDFYDETKTGYSARKRTEKNKECNVCKTQFFGAYSNRKKSCLNLGLFGQRNTTEEYEEKLKIFNSFRLRKFKQQDQGLNKISIADYIKNRNIFFDAVIIDEVHEGNKTDTLIGRAQTVLLKYGKKKILLSGTSNNGYAENMYGILRATLSRKLKKKGMLGEKGLSLFKKTYGITETTIFSNESDKKGGRIEKKPQTKDKEGISSAVFVDFMAENYLFLTFKDIRKEMTELVEEYVELEQVESVTKLVDEFSDKIEEINVRQLGMLKESTLRHMVNQPTGDWQGKIEIPIPFGGGCELVDIPKFDEELTLNLENNSKLTPKDEYLIKLVKEEIKLGRKTCVFTYFTGGNSNYMKGETIPFRIKNALEKEGIRVAVLERDKFTVNGKSKKIKNEERQIVLFDEKDNFDVLITNPKIVNVGVNLKFITNYVNYMPTYNVNEISQANRRGYRINTTEVNKVYHLYYNNTVEKEIIERFQTKRLESKAIEGVFDVNIETSKEDKLRTHSKSVSKLRDQLGNTKII